MIRYLGHIINIEDSDNWEEFISHLVCFREHQGIPIQSDLNDRQELLKELGIDSTEKYRTGHYLVNENGIEFCMLQEYFIEYLKEKYLPLIHKMTKKDKKHCKELYNGDELYFFNINYIYINDEHSIDFSNINTIIYKNIFPPEEDYESEANELVKYGYRPGDSKTELLARKIRMLELYISELEKEKPKQIELHELEPRKGYKDRSKQEILDAIEKVKPSIEELRQQGEKITVKVKYKMLFDELGVSINKMDKLLKQHRMEKNTIVNKL